MKSSRRKSYEGQTFGRWFVAGDAPDIEGRRYVVCTCQCGVTRTVILDHVVQGRSLSCGCFRKERQFEGRGTQRVPWKTSELQIVRKHYPVGGPKAVATLLTHRTLASIKMKAGALGLRFTGESHAN